MESKIAINVVIVFWNKASEQESQAENGVGCKLTSHRSNFFATADKTLSTVYSFFKEGKTNI